MVKSIIHATPKEKKRDKMSNRYKLKSIEIMAPLNASVRREHLSSSPIPEMTKMSKTYRESNL